MGNVYTRDIKRVAQQIFEEHKGEVTKDFRQNKELLKKYLDVQSKKVRNRVAGYLTRYVRTVENAEKMRQEREQELVEE
ncbi:30S ribosomal protein S17e [Sulfodiicoccus acidiphilus]|uniref:Small ribosomal subunit protein eS17 n=1 Tax=Sulfodiicoccus acidiphilus TaxID=1670455 RepID=A0A348B0B4_9CREN|nr:30S ribosomal protein S17e [Sulfodiicoccus acidiphilus]BBD71616.1 30S ribosomal protein S17e [Sulfodiicoccus acidiphilus]GGT87068.1 30S ribosomal protein S17e [Sulfodiicoccus acidiphilus]